jgi:hypothetical protein
MPLDYAELAQECEEAEESFQNCVDLNVKGAKLSSA